MAMMQDRDVASPDGRADEVARLSRYMQAMEFLYHEAELLDRNQLEEWLDECIAEDIRYFMPVRTAGDEADPFREELGHFDETKASLAYRAATLLAPSSFAGKPVSRMRRCVTNVRVHPADAAAGELRVDSYSVLFRNRFNETSYDIISAERRDRLRIVPDGLELCERLIVVDQSTLGTDNLAVFL